MPCGRRSAFSPVSEQRAKASRRGGRASTAFRRTAPSRTALRTALVGGALFGEGGELVLARTTLLLPNRRAVRSMRRHLSGPGRRAAAAAAGGAW